MANRRGDSVIDAAALQADMARRFNLPGGTRKIKQSANRVAVNQSSKAVYSSNHTCACCGSISSLPSGVCNSCGYFLSSSQNMSAVSLAEKRGLAQAAPKITAMKESEWDLIENKLAGKTT
jgi:hypothetical protein